MSDRKVRRMQQTRLAFDTGYLALAHRPSKDITHELPKTSSSPVLPSALEKEEENEAENTTQRSSVRSDQAKSTPFISPPTSTKSSPVRSKFMNRRLIEKAKEREPDINQNTVQSQSNFMAQVANENHLRMKFSHNIYSSEGSEAESDDTAHKLTISKSKSIEAIDLCSESQYIPTTPSTVKTRKSSTADHYTRISTSINLEDDITVPLPKTSEDEIKFMISPKKVSTLDNTKHSSKDCNSQLSNEPPASQDQDALSKLVIVSDSEEDVRSSPLKRCRKIKSTINSFSSSHNRLSSNILFSHMDESKEPASPLNRCTGDKSRRQQNLEDSGLTKAIESDSEEDVRSSLKRRRKVISSIDPLSSPNTRWASKISFNDTDESNELVLPLHRPIKDMSARQESLENSSSSEASSRRSLLKHYTRPRKGKKHRTRREKALELMRRKRDGEKIEKLTSSESSEEEESDHDLLVLSKFEDDDEGSNENSDCVEENREAENYVDGSDFIVKDDEGPLGIPDYASLIPLQFSHTAHKPLKEHFRDAIEWLVKNEIFPEFPRDDEVYIQAFRKLNDNCEGLARSKFLSSHWTPEFTTAILTRPQLISGPLCGDQGYETGEPKCDACDHRNHIPNSSIQFMGKPYNKQSLVEIDQSSDSEHEDMETSPQYKEWAVGRICKMNAKYAHSLIHWKFFLNEWVISELLQQGHLKLEEVSKRDRMSLEERNQHANLIIDAWEANGTIPSLYQNWKITRIEASRFKNKYKF
ncbi:hypothetical protein K3495_g12342 [Podosphaera aphanis]|nr:hypothetical protein K3495_g12342 [Podosphaera aphanis]